MYLYVDIAGSGNPLYVADFYRSWFYGEKSSIGSLSFAKLEFYMHEGDLGPSNGAKIGKNTPKKHIFPEMWQPK